MSEISRLVNDVTAAPLGQIIASVGEGVAEAQRALDSQAIEQLLELYARDDAGTRLLRESGWRPTFYTIPETEGEVRVALSLADQESDRTQEPSATMAKLSAASPLRGGTTLPPALTRALSQPKTRLYATPVDGSYRNRYGFEASVSATIRFRIVPVPPPPEADRMRVVPDLQGMRLTEAIRLLEGFDLVAETESEGEAPIEAQSPPPGTVVRAGTSVRVDLEN